MRSGLGDLHGDSRISIDGDGAKVVEAPDHSGREAFRQHWSSRAQAGDPANAMRVTRALIEQRWGLDLPDPAATFAPAEQPGIQLAEGTSTVQFSTAGGDLDGDGLADVLLTEYETHEDEYGFWFEAIRLHAARGTDGSPLWTHDLESAYDVIALPAGDLNGDGDEDILMVELVIDLPVGAFPCVVLACAGAATRTFHYEVTALDGAGGKEQWSKRYEGRVVLGAALASGLVAFSFVFAGAGENVAVLPIVSGDHDADGGLDVAVNAVDVAQVYSIDGALVGYAQGELLLTRTRATVVQGATGMHLLERNTDWVSGLSLLSPVGNAVGDDTTDLAWSDTTYVREPCTLVVCGGGGLLASMDVELIDGSSLDTAWTTTRGVTGMAWTGMSNPGDLDGNGMDDLMVLEQGDWSTTVVMIAGADGSHLWTTNVEMSLDLIGPVGGSPGVDVLISSYDWELEELSFVRFDGASGAEIFRTAVVLSDFDGPYVSVWWQAFGDVDGDRARDLAIEIYEYDDTFDNFGWTALLQSGATGNSLLSLVDTLLYSAPDLDGDGADDLLLLSFRSRSRGYVMTIVATSLSEGSDEIWSRTDDFWSRSGLGFAPNGDQDGDDGDDLLYNRVQVADTLGLESRTESLAGRTGTSLWHRGDSLTPLPVPAKISGTIRDTEGAPLEGACAQAWIPDPWYDGAPFWTMWTEAVSGSDGTYSLDELPPEVVLVGFGRCGTHPSIWWEGKPRMADADAIVLAEGEVRGGIDAVIPSSASNEDDDIAEATIIEALPHSAQRSTSGATTERGEPTPCDAGSTVWYRYTPEVSGSLLIDTAGSDFDTTAAAYTGDPDDLAFVGCSDDTATTAQARLEVPVEGGTTYWLQLGGYDGETGELMLSVR